MRLLATPSNASQLALEVRTMRSDTTEQAGAEEPRLLRQLPKSKVWIGWLDFREIPLGTTDQEEAQRRLVRMAENRQLRGQPSTQSAENTETRRPYRVYPEAGRFVVKYYDESGRRRKHWIPKDLAVPVLDQADAEAYAGRWYRGELDDRPAASTRALDDAAHADDLDVSTTFETFGRLWTSGRLASRFPDHVKKKSSGRQDESRLKNYVYALIGAERVVAFEGRSGLELVERAVAGLPPVGPTFRSTSRRQVIQTIHRPLTLAVYPAKLLSSNSLPKGFVPKVNSDRAKTHLFPSEDSALMRRSEVSVEERLFYGVLAREGLRVSELLDLTWADVDLERGLLTLDTNKTAEPRAWAMDPGVVSALTVWRQRFVPKSAAATPILMNGAGKVIDRYGVAERLREYLLAAGVTRPQLLEASDKRIPLRAHDLRATFVTLSLAQGKSEAWITDRTGHKSSQMICRYKRAARTVAELNIGALAPLNEAIPELG